MGVAWILTLLALAGVTVGVTLGRVRLFAAHLGAAGGGLLLGISLFWLAPEIAQLSGWLAAFGAMAGVAGTMLVIDRVFLHGNVTPPRNVILPVLSAAAIHSFLDGWSLRALAVQPAVSVAVLIGLALHKIPEGVALGWIAHKSFPSGKKAFAAAATVELMTLVGAFVEPPASWSGAASFGPWWTGAMLALISGSFVYLALHVISESWKRVDVLAVFAASLLLVSLLRP